MQQLNNMDIAILIIVGISALIALGRGLVISGVCTAIERSIVSPD